MIELHRKKMYEEYKWIKWGKLVSIKGRRRKVKKHWDSPFSSKDWWKEKCFDGKEMPSHLISSIASLLYLIQRVVCEVWYITQSVSHPLTCCLSSLTRCSSSSFFTFCSVFLTSRLRLKLLYESPILWRLSIDPRCIATWLGCKWLLRWWRWRGRRLREDIKRCSFWCREEEGREESCSSDSRW